MKFTTAKLRRLRLILRRLRPYNVTRFAARYGHGSVLSAGVFFGRYLLFNFRVYNFPGSSIPKNFVCRFSHFVVTFFPGDPNNGHIFWAARLAANIFPVLRSDKQSAKRKRITTLRFRTSIENIGTVRDYVNSTRDLRTWAREERRRWHIYIYIIAILERRNAYTSLRCTWFLLSLRECPYKLSVWSMINFAPTDRSEKMIFEYDRFVSLTPLFGSPFL